MSPSPWSRRSAALFGAELTQPSYQQRIAKCQKEWVRCGPGDTLVAPMNALHAFHNRTDKPSRFISSSVYYHEVFFETYAPTVDVNDPVPPKKEPTEAEGEQYLQLLKDAMKVHMYAPQANANSGLEVLRELEKRNIDIS